MCVRRQDGAGLRGGILFNVHPPVCRISWLVVAQSDRGIGVGRALVTEAEQRLDGPAWPGSSPSAKTTRRGAQRGQKVLRTARFHRQRARRCWPGRHTTPVVPEASQ